MSAFFFALSVVRQRVTELKKELSFFVIEQVIDSQV
jgi:hypothetical protein